MANERITENIVRNHFINDPLFNSTKFEEQKSNNIRVSECLSNASKNGKEKNIGKPEFIITFPTQNMEYAIVIECKASTSQHQSEKQDKPRDYAVDGVLHYSRHLSKEFNVISIAVSGEDESTMLVSTFLQKKNEVEVIKLPDEKLLSIFDYVKIFRNDQFNYNIKDTNIIEKAIKLNEDFHSCSIAENMRNTIVSGILLALLDDTFKTSYPVAETSKELAKLMLTALDKVLHKAKVKKIDDIMGVFKGILNEPLVKQSSIKKNKEEIQSVQFFKETISFLERQIFPLMSYEESGYDILGRFYTEFIRYAASKQKQGLVLTPSHVTELFCDLAEINVDDVVYDPCCGTGGFLIAAMKRMIQLAGNDTNKKEDIRNNQIIGVEIRPEMFTFACSNMMLRGDGKSNLDCADCFEQSTKEQIRKFKPTVAFLNPPYDQGTADQLHFIENALEEVAPQKGRVVAIVQMSCAIKNDSETNSVRERLLRKYNLKAVISMPDTLFYPVGVVTCIMVFDSATPNSGKKTWFGYLKDDGFVKRKNKGRIDYYSRWSSIKSRFLNAYKNNDEIIGLSVRKEVNFDDEWCAEAYMETDYSTISENDFEKTLKQYAIFKAIGINEIDNEEENDEES